VSIQLVLDGICQYFGGPYDQPSRTYRSSPIPGVGVVRRAFPKRDDHNDFFHGQQPGARTGAQMVVTIYRQKEFRVALGGEHSGMKQVNYEVSLACFLRSRSEYAEDAQDDAYELRDAIVDWMRLDRTLGDSVFQAGEYIEGAGNGISCSYGQPESKSELTKHFMEVTFAACEFVQA
jgi:hypothetical protein